ncbi:MAG: dockerin type I repeat-containing protein [Clostridia bacterium]|nr:dockerin type I repeat-containing protein [Clostridia bacterium]
MRKRILFAICFSLLVASLSIFVNAAVITSADDMLTLMNTPSMWADSYTLTKDIDLSDAVSGLAQAPIGNTSTPFTGTFDGDGYSINGLSLTDYTTNYVALFGYVSNATIKNLTVSGTVSSTGSYVAGVVGGVDGASITVRNCINRCTVSGGVSAAGIVGRIDAGTGTAYISGCKNEGAVTSTGNYAGGILAISTQKGGTITLEQCMNTGSVSGQVYVGGIVGFWRVYSASANMCTLQDCINTGSVYAAQKVVGGIMGTGNNQNYAYTLTRCFNSGSVTSGGSTYVRPIAGATSKATYSAGQMTYCYYSSTDSYTSDSVGYSEPNETYVEDETVAANFPGLSENWVVIDGHAPELAVFYITGSNTVYVSENGLELTDGNTDIGSKSSPFKNFTDAMQCAANSGKDATVIILDSAEIPENYITPVFYDTITVRGGTLVTNGRLLLGGNMIFENITISNNKALVLAAQEHKLVMDEGITVKGSDIYLVGGYESSLNSNSDIPATGYATDITIRSGTYYAVGGGNRFLDGAYSGTIKMTIGKTNPDDILKFTSTLVTGSLNYDGGDGVTATVIFDGDVDSIATYRPVGHAAAGVEGRFDVDIVVQGSAVIGTGSADVRGHDFTLNVYADTRVDGAEDFAAAIIGADNVQPYKRYCLKIKGTHPDNNADKICDNCGAPTACEHESGEWVECIKATCVSSAFYTWYCNDCQELIAEMTKTGEAPDANSHASENYTWQYAEGKYYFTCTACDTKIEQTDAPAIYVSANGDDACDGTTAEKAVATVEEAGSRIANVGGTVVICGSYVLDEDIEIPAHTKTITISGFDADDGYIRGGFCISSNSVISLGGDTKFDNISFDGAYAYIIECNWNNVEFGKIEAVNNACAHIVLGSHKITQNDSTAASATLTITEAATLTRNTAGSFNKTRFYSYIYLGSTFGADGIAVLNKTATLNATDADIGVLYTMSTSSTYKNTPVSNCEATVNLYGDAVVNQGRTGDYNVGYADSTASLKKQTLNFFDNASIGTNYYIRNAENTVINVSSETDGRTRPVTIPFTFYAYGMFATNNTPMNIESNYSTHSFATSVTEPLAFQNAANALKAVTKNVTDECVYDSVKVTVAATPGSEGTKLYACSCGRSYTEEYEYSCTDAAHIYLAKADGTYECTVCSETFDTVSGDIRFALSRVATDSDTVSVILSVNASEISAAQINVSAPDGFTFTGATTAEADGFYVGVSDDGSVVTLLSATGANADINTNFTLAYSVAETVMAGDYVFELTVPEVYNENCEMLIATPVSAIVTVSDEKILRGDIDDDGVVTVHDALKLIKAIVNNEVVANADMNGDGVLNLIDAMRIFKQIVK